MVEVNSVSKADIEEYLQKLRATNCTSLITRAEIEGIKTRIKLLKSCQIQKTPADYKFLRRYDLMIIDGSETLVSPLNQ